MKTASESGKLFSSENAEPPLELVKCGLQRRPCTEFLATEIIDGNKANNKSKGN
jgi:hypothetical protein